MVQRKSAKPGRRRVWRITADAPLGEFVDPDAHPPPRPAAGDPESGGWVMSSFDLKHGAEVSEGPDTVPDDLFDELFPPARATPKPRDPG
jgi:hypothetical protein